MTRDELLDTEVGGWRILLKVGQGATGSVYEARRGKRRVALKSIRPEVVQPESVERFRREARLLMEIDHPHVVRCFGAGETEDFVYMVLEFCDGGSLDLQLNRREKFSIEESIGVATSILEGLAAIHEKEILHRDVKPANVLIDSEGKIKLADFNLARGMTVNTEVTTTGTILGTPYYMAPEQVEAKNLGPPLDLYATGAMLYHMIAGAPPYQGSSPLQILREHMNGDLPELCEVVPEAPEQVAEAIKKLMAKDQADRPQTAEEALALFEGLEAKPLQVIKARDSERNRPRPRAASSSGASTMARPPSDRGETSENFRLERTHAMDPQQGAQLRHEVRGRPAQRDRPPPPDARQTGPRQAGTGRATRPRRRPGPGDRPPPPGGRAPNGRGPRPRQGQRPPPPMRRDGGPPSGAKPRPRPPASAHDSGRRPGPPPAAHDSGKRPAPGPRDSGKRPAPGPRDSGKRPAPGPRDSGKRPAPGSDSGKHAAPPPSDRMPVPAPRPTRPPVPADEPRKPVEVEPLAAGERQPLPRVKKSKLLDLVVLLLVAVAGVYMYDAVLRMQGRDGLDLLAPQLQRAGLADTAPVIRALERARHAVDGVPLFAWLPLVGFLLFDRVLARIGRVGILGRIQLRARAGSRLRSGDAAAAAEVYEQLGDRDRAARVCLEAGLKDEAAQYFTADGRTLQALEVADPFRALMVQGKKAEAGRLLLDRNELYPAADVLEDAGELERAIEALELGYKTDKIDDYAAHLGGVAPELAKRRLALRIAGLHQQRDDAKWAGIYFERAGDLRRAGEQFAQIGDARGHARCLLGQFPPKGRLSPPHRELALEAARIFTELKDGQGVELYARLGMFQEAAELCKELNDEPQAAQFFARAGEPEEGAKCAERAGNRQLAAQLYDDAGQHGRAAELYEQLGRFREAADSARRSGDPALLAQMLEKAGDRLGAARTLHEMGEHTAARDLLAQIPEADATWREGRVLTGEIEHRARRHAEAAAAYEAGLPTQIRHLSEVGPTMRCVASLQELGRDADALAVLERFEKNKLAPKDYGKRVRALRKKVGVPTAPARSAPPRSATPRSAPPRSATPRSAPRPRVDSPLTSSSTSSDEIPALRTARETAPLPEPAEDLTRSSPALRESDSGSTDALRASPPPAPVEPPPVFTDPIPTRAMPRAPLEGAPGAADLLGQSLGPFRLTQLVNEGTFTHVYEAQIEGQFGAEALVKVLRPEFAADPTTAADFVAAGRALVGVRHDHLLPLLDAGQDGDLAYFAYDATRDPDLDEMMAHEAIVGVQRACRIGAGILNAVAQAHELGLMHLDLKPSKVLVAPGSLARVHDFGVAQALNVTAHSYVDPRYAAPEQARGDLVGPPTDQYTAALLIYKMLTGRLPFSSKTPAGFWDQHAEEAPIDPRELAEVPHALADALLRAFQKDPGERFPDVVEFERVVAGFVRGGRESDRHAIPQAGTTRPQ